MSDNEILQQILAVTQSLKADVSSLKTDVGSLKADAVSYTHLDVYKRQASYSMETGVCS